jgi:hypothetical protein
MPRRLAIELTEVANVVESDRRTSYPFIFGVDRLCLRQVQDRPQQHRRMTVRQHEPIAIGPDRIFRIELHHPVP